MKQERNIKTWYHTATDRRERERPIIEAGREGKRERERENALTTELTRTKLGTWTEEAGSSPVQWTTDPHLLLHHDSGNVLGVDRGVEGNRFQFLLRQSGAVQITVVLCSDHWPYILRQLTLLF